MTEWLELCGFAIGFYALFCLMLYGKVRATPRPVKLWLRILPVWILIALGGMVLSMPIGLPLLIFAKHHSADPVSSGRLYLCIYFAFWAVWGVASTLIASALFREDGLLCDEAIQHGSGILQRIARSAIGPGDAARPLATLNDTSSRLQDLNLTRRD